MSARPPATSPAVSPVEAANPHAGAGGATASRRRSGILFDVDGTLLDTNYLHVIAWSRALAEAGLHPPMAAIHALVGMGSDKLIDRLVGGERQDVDEAHSRHYAHLRRSMRPLPGAADLLRACRRGGATVVLATSAKSAEMDSILDAIGAREAISAVVSSGDVERSKPDPDIFRQALSTTGLRAGESIVVGDTVWDIEAARRSGLACVCVTTGGIAREVLSQAGALAIYESVGHLCAELDRSPLAGYLAAA